MGDDLSLDGDGDGDGGSLTAYQSRESMVGRTRVRRALPQRIRRTIGAFCFADHIGPVERVQDPTGAGIGPHPHIGLQTVTWLLDGALRHLDSLGSDQIVLPGQLNLMTAGSGIAHAEEWHGGEGRYHGIQFWVAQPDATRWGASAFEHHPELPRLELGHAVGTVLIGTAAGHTSPARRDTDHFAMELRFRAGTTAVPVEPASEHGIVVLDGDLHIGPKRLSPGHLLRIAPGRDEVTFDVTEECVAMLFGGAPFESTVSMWWNFVARDHDELSAAGRDWNERDDDRFGPVASALGRIDAPAVPWGH